jgi:hypothetical protein
MKSDETWYNEFVQSPEEFKADPLAFIEENGIWDKYIDEYNQQTGLNVTEEFAAYCDYEGNRSLVSYESRERHRYYAELFTMTKERLGSGTGGEWLLEDADHLFGIFLTQETLVYNSHWADQVERYLKESEIMKKQFAKHCLSVLDELRIYKGEPKVVIFNQTT